MLSIFREFRQFAVRGNAVDIGVGVVLGAAFSSFIESFVKDMLLPPVGMLYTKLDFENLYISLSGQSYPSLQVAKEAGAATINYGLFIAAAVRFFLMLFIVFLVVRQVNRWKKPHLRPIDVMAKKECPYCCTPIPSRALICPNCASKLEEQQPASTNRKQVAKHPRWRVK